MGARNDAGEEPVASQISPVTDVPNLGPVSGLGRLVLAPIGFYTIWFCIFCAPILGDFATHFYCDRGDGLQNVWNLWWVRRAIVDLHTNPWFSTALHYPEGTTLVGATLNPFNGLLAIPLSWLFDPPAVHNSIVAFGFVIGGWTAFLLAYRLSSSYTGSLVGGFVFTFACYHFAHAQGHLQLVSLEFLPLFVLLWWSFLETPGYGSAAAAAAALLLVILCDYYYFVYAVSLGGLLLLWKGIRLWRERGMGGFAGWFGPLLAFVAMAGATSGAIAISLLEVLRGGVRGAHDPYAYSLDLLALFVPGGHWRFSNWTQGYWSRLPGNIHESSVHLGIAVTILVLMAWQGRRSLPSEAKPWFGILVLFFLLSLGPVLQVAGAATSLRLPYYWLEQLIPPLAAAGTPVRLVVVVNLCAAVLCAFALPLLRRRVAQGALLSLLLFEFWPMPLPTTRLPLPPYLEAVRVYVSGHTETSGGSVLDVYTPAPLALYFQTLHELPLATGYVARLPEEVAERRSELMARFRVGDDDYLRDRRNVRFVVTGTRRAAPKFPSAREIFRSPQVRVVVFE